MILQAPFYKTWRRHASFIWWHDAHVLHFLVPFWFAMISTCITNPLREAFYPIWYFSALLQIMSNAMYRFKLAKKRRLKALCQLHQAEGVYGAGLGFQDAVGIIKCETTNARMQQKSEIQMFKSSKTKKFKSSKVQKLFQHLSNSEP